MGSSVSRLRVNDIDARYVTYISKVTKDPNDYADEERTAVKQIYCYKYIKSVEQPDDFDRERALCSECLRIYKPYSYSETLEKAFVSGVDKLRGFDSTVHFQRRNGIPSSALRSTEKHCSLFRSVEEFYNCHRQLNRERRRNIAATFLCFDCEKYLCAKCITAHSEHFTFSENDKHIKSKWGEIETKMMQKFGVEGNKKEENIQNEQTTLCDVVDVKALMNDSDLEEFELQSAQELYISPLNVCSLGTLIDNKTILFTDIKNKVIQVYKMDIERVTLSINLTSIPCGFTKIPATDPSQCLVAVSFPYTRQICILNINTDREQIVASINVRNSYFDLAHCNKKLVALCADYHNLHRDICQSIHVMNMSGKIINNIKLNTLTGLKVNKFNRGCLSVHSESETIYVYHRSNPSCVICLSLVGEVLHSTTFIDLHPSMLFVDKDRHVYVMGDSLPLYKLSSDLSERVNIIDEDVANTGDVTSIVRHKDRVYIVSEERGCVYVFNVD